MHEVGVRLLSDKVSKLKDRRLGDNKKRLDVQDLLEILIKLTKEKVASFCGCIACPNSL